jgi:hypothetical protein
MKTVYLFDESGLFAGSYQAQESPLEPGVFIVPTLSTERPAPDIPKGKAIRFVAGEWILFDLPAPTPAPDISDVVLIDPVEKLKLFISANPDVAALLK